MSETPTTPPAEITSVLPMDQLTAFETAMAERASGIPIDALTDTSMMVIKTPLWTALAWVHTKRSEPTLTYEQYAKRVRPDEVMAYLFPDDQPVDEPAEGAPFHAEGSAEPEVDRGGASVEESASGPEVGDPTE
jgi:hypothetical protein